MKKVISIGIVLAGLAGGVLYFPFQSALVFEYENTGKLIAYTPLKERETFKVKYTHSIHLSDVYETYQIEEKGKVKQIELEYEDFAIGMPSDAQGTERFIEKEGHYFITNMNRTFEQIDLRVGQVAANHTLIVHEKSIPFSTFVKKGTWIKIDHSYISVWDALKGVNAIE